MPSKDINGIELNYRFDGPDTGPVLVMSNSLMSNYTMWDPQMPALIEAGFRALRYDTRGHGGSSASPAPYSIDMLSADPVALMDALDIPRAHFCGLSLGGMTGQKLGTSYPDRFASLALCATAAYIAGPAMWEERIAGVRAGGIASAVDGSIERWFTDAAIETMPEAIAKTREMMLGTSVEGFCGCSMAIRDMDQRESIRDITAATIVVVGELDPGTPVSASELIHAHIPGSTLVVIPDAKHFVNVEKADAFNRALLSHLEAHR